MCLNDNQSQVKPLEMKVVTINIHIAEHDGSCVLWCCYPACISVLLFVTCNTESVALGSISSFIRGTTSQTGTDLVTASGISKNG